MELAERDAAASELRQRLAASGSGRGTNALAHLARERIGPSHVCSNIGDCSTDPGALTMGQAPRARHIHQHCSIECQVMRRATAESAGDSE